MKIRSCRAGLRNSQTVVYYTTWFVKFSLSFSICSPSFRKVFANFSKCFNPFGHVHTCWDPFTPIRMHLDARGRIRKRLVTFWKLSKILEFWTELPRFVMFFDALRFSGKTYTRRRFTSLLNFAKCTYCSCHCHFHHQWLCFSRCLFFWGHAAWEKRTVRKTEPKAMEMAMAILSGTFW